MVSPMPLTAARAALTWSLHLRHARSLHELLHELLHDHRWRDSLLISPRSDIIVFAVHRESTTLVHDATFGVAFTVPAYVPCTGAQFNLDSPMVLHPYHALLPAVALKRSKIMRRRIFCDHSETIFLKFNDFSLHLQCYLSFLRV